MVREKLAHALGFLRHHLVPHALAEEDALYPAVEGAMQAPGLDWRQGGLDPLVGILQEPDG